MGLIFAKLCKPHKLSTSRSRRDALSPFHRETICANPVCGCPHQKLDLAHAEGTGAADVVGQTSRCRYNHMRLVRQLQGLANHVC